MLIVNRQKGERLAIEDEFGQRIGEITVTHATAQIELGLEFPARYIIKRLGPKERDDQAAFGLTKKKSKPQVTRRKHYDN